jgi:hypothetical protein
MSCQIIRNEEGKIVEVKAPNGNASQLYSGIQTIETDAERAALQWSSVYTPSFKKRFGNWEKVGTMISSDPGMDEVTLQSAKDQLAIQLDSNMEPLFSDLSEKGYFTPAAPAVDNTPNDRLEDEVTGAVVQKLQKEGVLGERGLYGRYDIINEEKISGIESALEAENIEYKRVGNSIRIYGLPAYEYSYKIPAREEEASAASVQELMRELDIPRGSVSVSEFSVAQDNLKAYNQQNDKAYVLVAEENTSGGISISTLVEDRTASVNPTTVHYEVIDRMKMLFPQLNVQMISANQINELSGGRFQNDDLTVNAFTLNGTVYLVKNRVNNDVIIEEFLHPFVYAMMMENSGLADSLYAEIMTMYPDLVSSVESTYTSFYGYTDEDRKNEILTKGLQRALADNVNRSYLEKDKNIRSLMDQFFDFIKNLLRQITSRNKLYVGKIPSNMRVSDIINLLDSDIQISLGRFNPKALANITEDNAAVLEYVTRNATEAQRQVVEVLLSNDVVHNEVDHTYTKVIYAEDGSVEDIIEYGSVTTRMKGKLADDDKYAFNRDLGTELDMIMNMMVMGETFDAIAPQLRIVEVEAAKKFYDGMQALLSGITISGSIVVPQVVLTADSDAVAGKMDLLVIAPDGTMGIIDLKTSMTMDINSKNYDKKYEVDSEESALYGERLSTRMQHGIQQQTYKRMLEIHPELTDFAVSFVKTVHFKSSVKDGKAVDVEYQGSVDHTLADYEEFVGKIVAEEPFNRTSGTESTLNEEQRKPENRQTVTDINDLVRDALALLQKRLDFYEQTNRTAKGKVLVSKEYMDELDEIIAYLNEALLSKKPAAAYSKLLQFINKDVKAKSKAIGASNNKAEILQFMLETEKDLKSYQEMLLPPKLYLNNKTLTKLANESLNYIYQTLEVIDVELEAFVVDFVTNNTNRDLTREEVEKIIQEAEDISMHDYLFADIATSSDLMLSVMDKVYKRRRQEIEDFVREVEVRIKTVGNQLAAVSPDKDRMYDFMQNLDEDGKPTGYIISKIGKQYWKKRKEIRDKLVDPETGERYKYRDVRNLKSASQADLDFNIELRKAKEEENNFNRKEYLNEEGELVDGPYHKYSDEFKEARKKVMRLKIKRNSDGAPINFEWVAKNPDSKEFKDFERKYYTAERSYLKPAMEYSKGTYDYKGRVEETSGRFVKGDYVEIRDVAENGESMVDPRYQSIMNPTTELGKAQKAYFEEWTSTYNELLSKLPAGHKMRNRLPLIRSHAMAQAKKMGGGSGYFTGVLKNMSKYNPFTTNTYTQQVTLDEDGMVVPSIPIFYVGDTKSESRIKKLKEKILDLQQRWAKGLPDANGKVLSIDEYKTEIARLNKSLKIENKKVGKDEISTEMTNNILEFARMAENYQVMSDFESTVVSVLRTLKNRKVSKMDFDNNVIKNTMDKMTAKFKGQESLVAQRMEKWMEMVFYRSKNPYQSKIGEMVKKVKLYMSIKGVGLNPFGQVNNWVRGEIEDAIEAAGGTLFEGKAYVRSVKEFNSDFLPSFFANKKLLTFKKGSDKNGDYYELPRGMSKYDAMVKKYRMMRPMMSRDGIEGFENKAMEMLFMMQHGAEYSIQTKTGVAVLMSKTVVNKVTGEKISLYDAHTYDEKTGTLILDSNLYEETDDNRYDTINYIYEVNKRLHGNYAWEDRMVIQNTLIGEMAAQFHKWVYPYYRRVYGKPYHDENLGETEGILRSFFKLFASAVTLSRVDGIGKKGAFKAGWKTLTPYQQSNIYRMSAYMGFFMLSVLFNHLLSLLADGVDDDDEELKKLVNFFVYQSERTMDELSLAINPVQLEQFVKNPVAIIGFTTDVLDALFETFKYVVPPYGDDSERFQRGVNKGELKWIKEWGDVFPISSVVNKWDSFEELKEFYIK